MISQIKIGGFTPGDEQNTEKRDGKPAGEHDLFLI